MRTIKKGHYSVFSFTYERLAPSSLPSNLTITIPDSEDDENDPPDPDQAVYSFRQVVFNAYVEFVVLGRNQSIVCISFILIFADYIAC